MPVDHNAPDPFQEWVATVLLSLLMAALREVIISAPADAAPILLRNTFVPSDSGVVDADNPARQGLLTCTLELTISQTDTQQNGHHESFTYTIVFAHEDTDEEGLPPAESTHHHRITMPMNGGRVSNIDISIRTLRNSTQSTHHHGGQ
jgi:hypothetical protein